MKPLPSNKSTKQPQPINRVQLASKSIAENIEKAKNTFYKTPQYCQYCSKLNDSAVTFKPFVPPSDRLIKTRVLNLRVDPYSSPFPGILQTQNLRLIEINQKCHEQKEELIQTVNKLVSQCKLYVQSYDSNRAIVGLQNIMRAVSGNVIVGYIAQQKLDNDWKSLESEKIKNEYLQKSIESLKLIIERNSSYFPLTRKTLTQKYYLSLQDFDQDMSNIANKTNDDANLLQLFKLRVNDFVDQILNNKQVKKMGLCQQQFDRLRNLINNLKQMIKQKQEEIQKSLSDVEPIPQINSKSSQKYMQHEDLYLMLLNQSLVIQQFLSQQQ